MKIDNSLGEIEKFWLWFEKNNALIRRVLEDGSAAKKKELTNYFDEKILSFGHFTWEINEGAHKKYQFIISPNREFELLQLSKKIIAHSPQLDFWEFGHAKTKVNFIEPFKVYDENLDAYVIDPSPWFYKTEGKTFYAYAPNLDKLDNETEQHVLDLVSTAVLGEENRILNINKLIRTYDSDESFTPI